MFLTSITRSKFDVCHLPVFSQSRTLFNASVHTDIEKHITSGPPEFFFLFMLGVFSCEAIIYTDSYDHQKVCPISELGRLLLMSDYDANVTATFISQ